MGKRLGSQKSATRKNIIKLLVLTSFVVGGYIAYGAIVFQLFALKDGTFTASENLDNVEESEDVQLIPLSIDFSQYIDSLSDFLDGMNTTEKAQFLQDMFGDGVADYLNDTQMTPDDFLDEYQDELGNLLQGISGDEFSSDVFDQFEDPALLAALLIKPMFFTYESNPGINAWDDKESTLFKYNAYADYDLGQYDWITGALESEGLIYGEQNQISRWKIKTPAIVAPQTKITIPTISPQPHILADSVSSSPLNPTADILLKKQSYLGGASIDTKFSSSVATQSTNFTYELNYNDTFYEETSVYENSLFDMEDYSGPNTATSACLAGPISASGTRITWQQYADNNPNFDATNNELNAFTPFVTATSLYEKMDAITDFIGANFVYDFATGQRPGDNEDPLEWFCRVRNSKYPFEFSYLAVALARMNGIPARYVSGYKYSALIDAQLGGWSYQDDAEGSQTAYPYLLGNLYSWMEVFLPTSETEGDWVAFDNKFTAQPEIPDLNDISYNIKVNDEFTPNSAGYERFDEFGDPNSLIITVNYTLAGNPLTSQVIEVEDITYGETFSSFYTESNGVGTFTLNLEELAPGAHVLNFSSSYLDSSFGNFTVINVIDEVQMSSYTAESTIITNAETDEPVTIFGKITDPETGQPVKNAVVNITGHEQPTVSDPNPPAAFGFDPHIAITDETGNYTITSDVPGFPAADSSRDYLIDVEFLGSFDISNDIGQFSPIYQSLFLAQYGVEGYVQTFGNPVPYLLQNQESVQLTAPNYHNYTFSINNAIAFNTTIPNYPLSGPPQGDRDGVFELDFYARTIDGIGPVENSEIRIYDETESNRIVATFSTNSSGEGEFTFDVAAAYLASPVDWTVGPHLLRMEWTNRTNLPYTQFWIFVQGDVFVNQTSEEFLNGNGGISPNRYHIDSRDPGDADDVNISGYIQDADTGEYLENVQIYFEIFNKNWNLLSSDYLINGPTNQTITTAGPFSQIFNFRGDILVSESPIYTNLNFTGQWINLSTGWQDSWNQFWQPYFYSLPNTNDTSDNPILLSDPTDFTYDGLINGSTLFGTFDTTLTYNNTLNITGIFRHDGLPLDGATVNFYLNYSSGVPDETIITGPNGQTNFSIFLFNDTMVPGLYNLTVEVIYPSAKFTEVLFINDWVLYNPLPNYNLLGRINGSLFETYPGLNYDTELLFNDTLTISGYFYFNVSNVIQPLSGANIILYDNGNPIDNAFTDASGYVNFSILFDGDETFGSHVLSLNLTYNEPAYTVSKSKLINVYYNATAGFESQFWVNSSTLFSTYPGGIYPFTQYLGDSLDLSIFLRHVTSTNQIYLMEGVSVELYDTHPNGTTFLIEPILATTAAGYANYTIDFDNSVEPGEHNYTLRITYAPGAFTYVSEQSLNVTYDPAALYTFTPRIEGDTFEFYAPDSYLYPEVQGPNYVLHFSAALLYGGQPVVGETVFFSDLTNSTFDDSAVTDENGYVNFTIIYPPLTNNGTHTYRLSLSFTNGTYSFSDSGEIYVEFDRELLHQFLCYIDSVNFFEYPGGAYPIVHGANDTINLSARFVYDSGSGYEPQPGITVTLNDNNNGTFTPLTAVTDADGWVTFLFTFDNNTTPHLHQFELSMNNGSYAYQITEAEIIKVNFDPESDYFFIPRLEGQLFGDYPGQIYPTIQKIGDTLQISAKYLYNNSGSLEPVPNALVYLTYLDNGTFYARSKYTNLAGEVNFTIWFNNTLSPVDHQFRLNITHQDIFGFTMTDQDTVEVPFDPTIGYTLDSFIEGINFETIPSYDYPISQANGDQVNISILFSWLGQALGDANADVVLTAVNNVSYSYNLQTNAKGWANFTIYFNDQLPRGDHRFEIALSYINGSYTITNTSYIIVNYNPDLGYVMESYLEGTDFDTIPGYQYGVAQTVGDSVEISCNLAHFGISVEGATVTLTSNNSYGPVALTTLANGWANFTVNFDNTVEPGFHQFSLALSYTNGSYTITNSSYIIIEYDPTIGYNFVPRLGNNIIIDSTNYGTYQYNTSFDISARFDFKGTAIDGKTVQLYLVTNNTVLSVNTDLGDANFTIILNGSIPEGFNEFRLSINMVNGTFTITEEYTFYLTFDPELGFEYLPLVENQPFNAGDLYGEVQLNDTLQFSATYLWNAGGFSGATFTVFDNSNSSSFSVITDENGEANITLFYDANTLAGLRTYTLTMSYSEDSFTLINTTTIQVNFQPLQGFTFIPRLSGDPSLHYTINTTGEYANISYQILHQGTGVAGAIVSLEDLTNGTTSATMPSWSTVTDANGYGNILVYYDTNSHSGAHNYRLTVDYDFGLYSVGANNDSFWVIYNTALEVTDVHIPVYSNFTTTNDGDPFNVIGNLVAVGTNKGHYDATLTAWVKDPYGNYITDEFTITLDYYNDQTDGEFRFTIEQKPAATLTTGNYSIIVGFNGTLAQNPINDPAADDYALTLAVNGTAVEFSVYDQPTLTSSYSFNNPWDPEFNDGIIPDATQMIVNGTLTYSNGTVIVGEEITIVVYNADGDVLYTNTVTTDNEGKYEFTFTFPGGAVRYKIIYEGSEPNRLFRVEMEIIIEEEF